MLRVRIALAAVLGLTSVLVAPPAPKAEEGDRAGWSVATDPRRRAFLVATETAGGPRLLTIACLRDADSFAIYSAGVPGLAAGEGVELTLAVADAEYRLTGSADADRDTGVVGFSAESDIEGGARKKLARELLPVLKAPGPIVLTIGSAPPVEIPLEDLPPRAGIAGPLKTFEKICFGK